MTRFFLSIDIGASKSNAPIADENGKVVGGVLLGMESEMQDIAAVREKHFETVTHYIDSTESP